MQMDGQSGWTDDVIIIHLPIGHKYDGSIMLLECMRGSRKFYQRGSSFHNFFFSFFSS